MKLKLIGNMLMVTSKMKKEDFIKALKVEPTVNKVVNEETGNTEFIIKFDDEQATPKFTEFSATFNQTDDEGKMVAIIPLTPSEDHNQIIVDVYGSALNATKHAEETVAAQVAAVNNSMAELLESIEEA